MQERSLNRGSIRSQGDPGNMLLRHAQKQDPERPALWGDGHGKTRKTEAGAHSWGEGEFHADSQSWLRTHPRGCPGQGPALAAQGDVVPSRAGSEHSRVGRALSLPGCVSRGSDAPLSLTYTSVQRE